ncbi:hypothetical protein RCL1_000188 [Eukaryota sp. TZLM3-RCL]
MSSFASSSQRRYWFFSEPSLLELRSSLNQTVPLRLDSSNVPIPKLTVEEEQFLRYHFEAQLVKLLSEKNFSLSVIATALTFFKRVFIRVSIMDRHPHDLIPAIVFIALKVEELKMSASQCANFLQFNHNLILEHEFDVLSFLDYQLFIHHPLRPLMGIIAELVEFGLVEESCRNDVYSQCEKVLVNFFYGDAFFLFSPAQMAISCVSCVLGNDVVNNYIEQRYRGIPDQDSSFQIIERCSQELRKTASILGQLNSEFVDFLMRKLSKCRNPLYDSSTEMYKHAQMARIQAEKDLEEKKINEVRSRVKREYENVVGSSYAATPIDVIGFDDSP